MINRSEFNIRLLSPITDGNQLKLLSLVYLLSVVTGMLNISNDLLATESEGQVLP